MKKRIMSLLLALMMLVQIIAPEKIFAEGDSSLPQGKYATVGKIDFKSFDSKTMIEMNKVAARNRKTKSKDKGVSLYSSGPYFDDDNEPTDEKKLKYHGNVKAKLSVKGLNDGKFQWNEIFGVDKDGDPKPVQLIFTQFNDKTGTETGVERYLKITKAGTYAWTDGDGKPAELPLFNNKFEPFFYEVRIDEDVADKVKLLTATLFGSQDASPTFEKPDAEGRIKFNLTLALTLQQVTSTKFTSKWSTGLAESDRPQIQADATFSGKYMGQIKSKNLTVDLPKNDTDEVIVRDLEDSGDKKLVITERLSNKPTIDIKTDTPDLTFEEEDGVKTVKSGDHKFKYDFTYDVINGGKLTMTEIIPITFDANGGKFENFTAPDTEKKIVKEVDYDGTLTDKPDDPTNEEGDFRGWSKTKNGDPLSEDELKEAFKNIRKEKTFYAIYGKAGAKITYLDLNGKKIDGKFKFDKVDYPEEKEGKAGNPIIKGDYTAETAPKFIGYKFNRVELNPVDAKYGFDKKDTIKLYYEKLPDVIPAKDGSGNKNEKPDGYVEVKFVPTDKAKDTTEKIFYVNPKKDVTIPIADPEAIATYTFKEWKMGANADGDGAVYTPSTPNKFTEPITVITATYEETKNIIPYDPSVPDPMVRPEGYVKVTFAADQGLKLTEQKAYYVKKNAGIKLGNEELVKPGYEAQTGYKFDKWDKEDSLVIEATDIVVTAKATKLDNVIPEKTGETPNEKPDGYKEVTFVIKSDDATKGSIEGVAKFYVNPTAYVTINPPATKAETGYEFGTWDKNTLNNIQYKEDTTITGSFNDLEAVIPKTNPDGKENKQPAGYKKVEFVIDPAEGGKIADKEVTIYYVNPAKEVTVSQPKTKAEIGYEFDKWDKDTATAKKYDKDTTVKGNFKNLNDIIPSKDKEGKPNVKPEGYVTVTFDKGANGKSIEGQTVYYVNPKAGKKLADITKKPKVSPETGYKADGWDKKDSQSITENLTVTAEYKEIDDVIPKTKEDESEKPEGYITVTFVKGEHGELKGNTTFFVNPNKAVVLEDKAPTIKPNAGFTSAGWDTSINKAIQYKDGDKIIALYNEKDDVIPQKDSEGKDKPEGYLTVTFDKGEHGTLSEKTVYYVKPGKEVTVPAPTVNPTVGYEFEKWDKELTQTFSEDTTITAEYKTLAEIIPQGKKDGSDKPDGYFTITFKADGNGSLSGTTVYYVKPNVDVDLTNTAENITKNPKDGYTAVGVTWDKPIASKKYTDNEIYTFNFKKLDDIIPGTDKNGKENEKPNGYVKVEFATGKNGTLTGNRIYFVNPKAKVKVGELTAPKINAEDGYEVADPNWTVNSDKKVAMNKEMTITKDITFTANYNALCEAKIIYKPNNPAWGSVSLDEEAIKNNADLKGSIATPKEGYVFVGWFKNKEDGEQVGEDKKLVPKKFAATYIAVFKKKGTENPKDGSLTITKKLENDQKITTSEPTKFKFSVTGPNKYKKVFELEADASETLKDLAYGDYKVKETDSKGYTAYYALNNGKESQANEYTVTINSASLAKLIVTNKKEKPTNPDDKKINVISKKVWVGVPNGTKTPNVKFQLYRKTENSTEEEIVGEAKDLVNNEVNFGEQDKKDKNGKDYYYFVKELNEDGTPFSNPNYTSKVDGLTVTNTYKTPEVEEKFVNVVAYKKWVNVPDGAEKPSVKFQLRRIAHDDTSENVVETKDVLGNPDGSGLITVDFGQQKEFNDKGYKYSYYVVELDANGNVINNGALYEATENNNIKTTYDLENMIVTNAYVGKDEKITPGVTPPVPTPDPTPRPEPEPTPEPGPNPKPNPQPNPNPNPGESGGQIPTPTPTPTPQPDLKPNPQPDQRVKPNKKPGSNSNNRFGNNKVKKTPKTGVEDTTLATYALAISSALLGIFVKKKKK